MSEPGSEIEGIWQMVRAERGGEPAPDLVVEQTMLELNCGQYVVRFAGEIADRGTFTIGADRAGFIVLHSSLALRGQMIPAIYQIRGNLLRVCYGLDGASPASFNAAPERYVATYRRHGNRQRASQ